MASRTLLLLYFFPRVCVCARAHASTWVWMRLADKSLVSRILACVSICLFIYARVGRWFAFFVVVACTGEAVDVYTRFICK